MLTFSLPAMADTLQDGIQALKDGRLEEAEQLLRTAAQQKPQDPVPMAWLTKLFEETMDPAALNTALNELHRRQAALKAAAQKLIKPAAQPQKPAHPARIQLDGSSMPSHEDELVDLGTLPPLPPDPLVHTHAPGAPPVQTSAWRRWRVQQIGASLSALKATLSQLQSRFTAYGQAPAKVQQMTKELETKIENQSKVMKQLQAELGE
jgi:peptidoglycan hydrolase CwlO-like protein